MITVKSLVAKNFMSIGNASQCIDFDRQDLTLVLGENLDLGGDGSRNGVGKTTILNGLSYALFGHAISNIRKDHLINLTNAKNMLVSLEFKVGNVDYKIERGRKPNLLKFYVNNQEQDIENDAQGDSRETQTVIESTIGMSHDMFQHIVALNTYTTPFLSLNANSQRTIIEQLLGITLLSEKSEKIKELNRLTKDKITQEEFRIRAVQEANKKIEEQIESLKKRLKMWNTKRDEDCTLLRTSIDSLSHINIEDEIQNQRDFITHADRKNALGEATRWLNGIVAEQEKDKKTIQRLKTEIASLEEHKCYACGQGIHDAKQDEIQQSKQTSLAETVAHYNASETKKKEYTAAITKIGKIEKAPKIHYDNLEEALNHRNSLDALQKELVRRETEVDPYAEQIKDMQGMALQVVSYTQLNEFTRLQDHQEFLLKLLTSKDSFIRKKIIEQNLSYLNARLTHYLDRIGLPHSVVFQNDLTVQIEELGRELDFDNLSRGERNRLILSMSWAFRDVYESLYQPINILFIDEMIDSGLDTQGVENALALLKKMSRERKKSIWLVSHRDELASRVENILKVIKTGGFTEYSTDTEQV